MLGSDVKLNPSEKEEAMANAEQQMLWSIARLAERWDVSKEFVRKLIAQKRTQQCDIGGPGA
jgi:hypothetical protein